MVKQYDYLINAGQRILTNARDFSKLTALRERLRRDDGGIAEGEIPDHEWGEPILGETYGKVILASPGIERLQLKDITVLGGWCAVRTLCMRELSEGILTDPVKGTHSKYSTVEEVCRWLETAVSADQIIESIGIYQGSEYVAISEERLWSEKVIRAVESVFGRSLTPVESDQIKAAVERSEIKRYESTKRYIEYVSGKPVNLTRVPDKEIFDELIAGRDDLFRRLGITLDSIVHPVLQRIKEDSPDEKQEQDLYGYIGTSTLVWFMYTGAYLNILKKRGYVKTKNGVVIEPWSHARSNESEAEFNKQVLSGANNYLKAGGENADIAFVGIDEASLYNFRKIKSISPLSAVPNILNYREYVDRLQSDDTISSLDLNNNLSFTDGVNYLPYGKCAEELVKMIAVRDEFRTKRDEVKRTKSRSDIGEKIAKLRVMYEKLMKEHAEAVNAELLSLFEKMFTS